MQRMVEQGVTRIKNLWSMTTDRRNEILDKRWQSHVSWMLCLGLTEFPEQGKPLRLTSIAKEVLRDRDVRRFMLQQMSRWQLPNGNMKTGDITRFIARKKKVQPFIMLLEALKKLKEIHGKDQAYLERSEIIEIIMQLYDHQQLPNAIQKIFENRTKRHLYLRPNPTAYNYLEIILSFFTATGVVEQAVTNGSVIIRIRDNFYGIVDQILTNHSAFLEFTPQEKRKWFEYYGSPVLPLPEQVIRQIIVRKRRQAIAKDITNLDELRRESIEKEMTEAISEAEDPQDKKMRQKLLQERTARHQEVVITLAKTYLQRGIRPKRNDFDLLVEKGGVAVLHEVKTINPEDRRDERLQIIDAIGKLLYYEYFSIPEIERKRPEITKFVVFDREPSDQYHIAFIRKIGIHALWIGANNMIEGHPESIAELNRILGG